MSAARLKSKASGGQAAALAPAAAGGHGVALQSTAYDCMVCELLPLLRAADLLANCLRVLDQFNTVAEIRPEFGRALSEACTAWRDPFLGADDETPEAVLSGLLKVATEAGRKVTELGAEGGAA